MDIDTAKHLYSIIDWHFYWCLCHSPLDFEASITEEERNYYDNFIKMACLSFNDWYSNDTDIIESIPLILLAPLHGNMDEIVYDGLKIIYRALNNVNGLQLLKNINGNYVVNRNVCLCDSLLDVRFMNNGVFPFIPKKYESIILVSSDNGDWVEAKLNKTIFIPNEYNNGWTVKFVLGDVYDYSFHYPWANFKESNWKLEDRNLNFTYNIIEL